MSLSHNPPISAAPPDRATVTDRLRAGSSPLIALLSLLAVVVIGNAHGGYYPTAWGWCVLAFVWLAGIAYVVAGRIALDRLELAFVAAIALFVGWNALSIAWTSDIDQSVLEVQRGLVYLFGVLAALLIVRRGNVGALLGGLLAGAVWLSVQALGSRLFPEVGGVELILQDRIQGALGYANAFGLLGVMAALLAFVFAVHARSAAARAAAGAVLPVLVTTAYFTYSRGAMLAAVAGLLAMIALDRRRLTLITAGALVALPTAIGVWIASEAPALTSSRASPALIADEGRELAALLAGLSLGSALVAVVAGLVGAQMRVPRGVRRAFGAVLACAAVALVVGGVMSQGGPGSLVSDAYRGVNQDRLPANDAQLNDLNFRLASIGTTPRVNFWRIAWEEYREHPWVGSGAGTYEQFWHRDRPNSEQARDAHSLYLETLAQLGWPGLLLLLGMLALPLAAVSRERHEPLTVAAFGVYVAYLVRAGIDWDWEMPALTLLALLCAVALFALRDERAVERRDLSPRTRAVGLATVVALAGFSLVGLVGNRALDEAIVALERGDATAAETSARKAVRWAPWSAEARRQLGRAQLQRGRENDGLRNLRESAKRRPDDWRIWYDLGIASSGRQRERAFMRAATLNPMQNDIEALRDRGLLPRRRAAP